MNETERQDLLQDLTRRLNQPDMRDDDALFDALDDVRLALQNWDLQGDIPHQDELRAWGLLGENGLPPGETAPRPDEAQLQDIHNRLRQQISAALPGTPYHAGLRGARDALRGWDGQGELPCADWLAEWGIWPPDADAGLWPEFEAACALAQTHPRQAIERLQALQARAAGRLADRLKSELDKTHVELERRAQELIAQAEQVARQKPQDREAQAQAWRAVTDIKPDSLEAQDALARLDRRVQEAIAAELDEIERQAQNAAQRLRLPDLNACLGRAEGLRRRGDLPADLAVRAKNVEKAVLALRQQTRDELGVASTKKVEGDLREAYELAHEYMGSGVPVIPDTGGVLGPVDADVPTGRFWELVSADFLAATRQKVAERLTAARAAKRQSPLQALAELAEARGWLVDEVWTPDHRKALNSQLEEVDREIATVQEIQKNYDRARERVTAARQTGVPAREQLQLLNQAEQLYSDYPQMAEYIESARDNLAGQLAGDVAAQIAQAQLLAGQEQFDRARAVLSQARAAALQEVPQPKPDGSLAQALARLAGQEEAVNQAEQSLAAMSELVDGVEQQLAAYDDDKNLLRLEEAARLLEQVPPAQRDHFRVATARAKLAVRQGDRKNFEAGRRAYESRNWTEAYGFFVRIGPAFEQADQAALFRRRAQAAAAMDAARAAEQGKNWANALVSYRTADEWLSQAGEDGLTAGLRSEAQSALRRLSEIQANDREITRALDLYRAQLEGARKRIETRQNQTRRDQLSPLPEIPAIVADLESKQQTSSTLGTKIDELLGQARTLWRDAFLPALWAVANDPHVEEVLLEQACQRAQELKAAGLLYADKAQGEQDVERLYDRLKARLLDQEYERIKRTSFATWSAQEQQRRRQANPPDNSAPVELDWLRAIEQNRQERWDLPEINKPEQIQAQLKQARQACLACEMDQIEEQQGAAAAQQFLGNQIRSGLLGPEPDLLRMWIELCWRAQDWPAAQAAAQRFADTGLDDRETWVKIWLGLTDAAREFADLDIPRAQAQLASLRAAYDAYGELFDQIESRLTERTLRALRDAAREAQGRLSQAPESERIDLCLDVVRRYAQILMLAPKDGVALHELKQIEKDIKPLIEQRCQKTKTIKVTRGDIKAARDEAARLLIDLQAIQGVMAHLTLPADTQTELEDSMRRLQARKEWWESALRQWGEWDGMVNEALSSPSAIDPEDPDKGGWDLNGARQLLTALRNKAIHRDIRDDQVLSLVNDAVQQIERFEGTAGKLMELARPLMEAVRQEQFDVVITRAQELETMWKDVTKQDARWSGLERVIDYTYQWPTPSRAQLPRHHRDYAIKQRENAGQWKRHADEMNRLYGELVKQHPYQTEDDIEYTDLAALEQARQINGWQDLKEHISLNDLLIKCDAWLKQCSSWLSKLGSPPPPPQSKQAEEMQNSIWGEERKAQLCGADGLGGARGRITALKEEIEQAKKELDSCLRQFDTLFAQLPPRVKKGRVLPDENFRRHAVRIYQACRDCDPKDRRVEEWRKKLENLRFKF